MILNRFNKRLLKSVNVGIDLKPFRIEKKFLDQLLKTYLQKKIWYPIYLFLHKLMLDIFY